MFQWVEVRYCKRTNTFDVRQQNDWHDEGWRGSQLALTYGTELGLKMRTTCPQQPGKWIRFQ